MKTTMTNKNIIALRMKIILGYAIWLFPNYFVQFFCSKKKILTWKHNWMKFCWRMKINPNIPYIEDNEWLEKAWGNYYMKWIRERNRRLKSFS